jgi:hypothetical protein
MFWAVVVVSSPSMIRICHSAQMPVVSRKGSSACASALPCRRYYEQQFGLCVSPMAQHLLCGMLHPDPAKRMSLQAVKSHPWTLINRMVRSDEARGEPSASAGFC